MSVDFWPSCCLAVQQSGCHEWWYAYSIILCTEGEEVFFSSGCVFVFLDIQFSPRSRFSDFEVSSRWNCFEMLSSGFLVNMAHWVWTVANQRVCLSQGKLACVICHLSERKPARFICPVQNWPASIVLGQTCQLHPKGKRIFVAKKMHSFVRWYLRRFSVSSSFSFSSHCKY